MCGAVLLKTLLYNSLNCKPRDGVGNRTTSSIILVELRKLRGSFTKPYHSMKIGIFTVRGIKGG